MLGDGVEMLPFELPPNTELVSWETFRATVQTLSENGSRAVDCETTGLRVHHGDRLFSIIVDDGSWGWYFNFQDYGDALPEEYVLDRSMLLLMKPIFANEESEWAAAWARYDLHMLANEGLLVAGTVHCTRAQGLVEYNEHQSYSLSAEAERIGLAKDDAVMDYIKEHKLSEKVAIPGKAQRATVMFFDRVPPNVMIPYGLTDGRVCWHVAQSQKKTINEIAAKTALVSERLPRVDQVYWNEIHLTKTVFNMERRGILIDIPFTKRALEHENEKHLRLENEFLSLSGEPYSASPKLYQRIFEDQKEKWQYTEKGNPSFDKDTLKKFDGPMGQIVNGIRGSKSRIDFFNGFLYHVDKNGFIHPILNQDGAGHGRFSSSDPNCQNLKKNDDEDKPMTAEEREFQVRRSFIVPEGWYAFALDYKQAEYRLVLDQAGELPLIRKIMDTGLDVHQVVADEAQIKRGIAKNINFGLLYGQGEALTAQVLQVTRSRARELRNLVLDAMPNVAAYNQGIMQVAKVRGYIFNWYGRRCYFPPSQYPYRALNYAIAGGTADIVKLGMNRLERFLANKKSCMIWNVHDENWFVMHPSELHLIPEIKRIMETAYLHKHLPMECDVEWSETSFGTLGEWKGESLAS